MPRAGQVLYHKDFIFADGKKGNKLVIVLNTCDNDKTCLVLKTTSQPAHYPQTTPGCNSCRNVFCIFEECDQGFDKDTYVQMDYIYPVNVDKLLSTKQISFVDHLTDVCFTNLKRCLRNFRDDIPQQYWATIYSAK